MNELASMTIGQRQVRSIDEKEVQFFPKLSQSREHSPHNSQYFQSLNHQTPINLVNKNVTILLLFLFYFQF